MCNYPSASDYVAFDMNGNEIFYCDLDDWGSIVGLKIDVKNCEGNIMFSIEMDVFAFSWDSWHDTVYDIVLNGTKIASTRKTDWYDKSFYTFTPENDIIASADLHYVDLAWDAFWSGDYPMYGRIWSNDTYMLQ